MRPIAALDQVLDTPVPARSLAVCRILVGFALVAEVLYRIRARGLVPFDPNSFHVPYADWIPVPGRAGGAVIFGVWLVAAVLFTIGWKTLISGLTATAAVTAYLLNDHQNFTNHTYLFVLVVGILSLGGSGAALSVDAHRRGEATLVAPWPVFLLKAQLSIIYFWAAVQKANPSYLSGHVIEARSTYIGPRRLPMAFTPSWATAGVAVFSICAEAFMCVALWRPRLRPYAFGVAALLHGGVLLFMNSFLSLAIFTVLWLGLFVLFLDPTPRTLHLTLPPGRERVATTIRRLDWLHKIDISVDASATDWSCTETSGRRSVGFSAVGTTLENLPVSFLWAPLLRVVPLLRSGRTTSPASGGAQ